ncbi:MAG: HAMP domain-containing sensor histidine kinase [Pseudoflavonifractor sp.]
MLIIVLGLCLLTSIFVFFRRRDSLSVYLLGMCLANCVMLAGVIIYIAKMGGFAATQKSFLFLTPGFQRWLQYLPLPMDKLGYMVAVGRCLFPLFALLAALEITMIGWVRRRLHLLRILACILPAACLVYYYPPVFRAVVGKNFGLLTAMIPISLLIVLTYLLLTVVLMVAEYRATTMHFFKRNFRYVLLSFLGTGSLYFLYATKDPAQIYNFFISEYIRMGVGTFIGPGLTGLEWTLVGVCTVAAVVVGSYGMVRYTQIGYDEGRQDQILKRKFDDAGIGISVFVHGIKNQLLSSRVLHKRLSRALEAQPPDLVQVRAYADQLCSLNEGMLRRMEELYRTIKNSALSLTPVSAAEVVNSAVERFHGKYPDQPVQVTLGTSRLVLADLAHLSEAIYNLLTNGYESAVQAGRETPQVELLTEGERMWTIFEVRDNGTGISAEQGEKIYDPFFTSKNTNYNWGMGLYYVRKVVMSHWGKLRFESTDGATSFFVMLPLFDEKKGE